MVVSMAMLSQTVCIYIVDTSDPEFKAQAVNAVPHPQSCTSSARRSGTCAQRQHTHQRSGALDQDLGCRRPPRKRARQRIVKDIPDQIEGGARITAFGGGELPVLTS
jgi:hypothetical protein